MIIQLEEFTGEAPRWHPRVLQQPYAQQAILTKFDRRTLAPFKQLLAEVVPAKVGTMQTIYRFGQDEETDAVYWFHWTTPVSVIRTPAAGDSDERTYYFGDGEPRLTDETMALTGGGAAYPIGYKTLGLPRPGTPGVSLSGTATSEVAETRVYTYTYVSARGEEGPPASPGSAQIDVKPGEVVTVDISDDLPAGEYDIEYKNIYRTGTGEKTSDYLFVAAVAATETSFEDTVLSANLGGVMQSLNWEQPPSDIVGAVLMPNGVVLAWRDNEIWPSEPFIPHAYPSDYTLTTDFKIVGVAITGISAVVVTLGQPYIVSGVHPASFTMEKLDVPQAGVSRRAVIAVSGGVAYASPDGIVFVANGQADVITKDLYRREDWQALNPASMHMVTHEDRLYCFYDNTSLGGTPGGLIFNFLDEKISVVEINQYFSAAYTDIRRDALFFCGDSATLTGAPDIFLGDIVTSQRAQSSGISAIGTIETLQAAQSSGISAIGTIETLQAAQSSSAQGGMVRHYPLDDDGTLASGYGYGHLVTTLGSEYHQTTYTYTNSAPGGTATALPAAAYAWTTQAIPLPAGRKVKFEARIDAQSASQFGTLGLAAAFSLGGTPTGVTAVLGIEDADGSTPRWNGAGISAQVRTSSAVGFHVGIDLVDGAVEYHTTDGSITSSATYTPGPTLAVTFYLFANDAATPVNAGGIFTMTALPAAADMTLTHTAGTTDYEGNT